jgi:hypothetical protein
MDPVNLAHVKLRELLEEIEDPSPESAADRVLDQLNHTHFPALRRAAAALNVKKQGQDFRCLLSSLYYGYGWCTQPFLDPELSYTWRKASMIVAKSQGHGSYRARTQLVACILDFEKITNAPQWPVPLLYPQ